MTGRQQIQPCCRTKCRHGITSVRRVHIVRSLAILAVITWSDVSFGAPFSQDNLVVVRIGDTGVTGAGLTTPVFLDEYTRTGGLPVQSIPLPIGANGANAALTLTNRAAVGNGSSANGLGEGGLTRSVDGQYLTVAGYDAAPGATRDGAPRTIARIDGAGQIDTTTTLAGSTYLAIRSVVTDDGSRFWATGNQANVQYTALGAQGTSSSVWNFSGGGGLNNLNNVNIFDGQLYITSAGGNTSTQGLDKMGVGLPVPPPLVEGQQVLTPLAPGRTQFAFVLLTKPGDLSLFNGLNTAYIADSVNGLLKYTTANGSNWTFQYGSKFGGTDGFLGVTGEYVGSLLSLFGTTANVTNNSLVSVTDTGSGFTFDLLASAGPNQAFAGVALAPVPAPAAIWLFGSGLVGVIGFLRRRADVSAAP